MIDPKLKDDAYAAIRLLKKRNDRVVAPLTAYIEAIEQEMIRYDRRLAQPIVAHLEDFETLAAASEAAQKRAISEAATQALPAISPRECIMEAIANAEATEAAKAANKPFWKFWAASSGGEVLAAKDK